MCAQWMDAAARRGPFGSTGALQRLLRLAPQEEEAPLLPPTSNFALCDGRVKVAALVGPQLATTGSSGCI